MLTVNKKAKNKKANHKKWLAFTININPRREATAGFEPAIGVLQTPALPLGHVAIISVQFTGYCRMHFFLFRLDQLFNRALSAECAAVHEQW